MFTQQVTAGFFEAPSLWIPPFMAIDKIHWLPIHSLMLMFDQCDCRTFSQCCLLTVDHTKGVKNILSRLLGQFMSCSALPFVGKMAIFMCIWLYLQILFKYRQNIKYKYAPFCDFQFKYKIHQMLVFKYKYVFEPNPGDNIMTTNLPMYRISSHPRLVKLDDLSVSLDETGYPV